VERPLARNPALDCALALARTPMLAAGMRSQQLPDGVRTLLSLVAREPGALEQARRLSGVSGAEIMAAAELYVQQVLLHPKADQYRALGLSRDCDRKTARTHMRLLMTWLHPDHNENAWRSAFAHRVLAAWKDVSRAAPSAGDLKAAKSNDACDVSPRAVGRLPWVRRPLPPHADHGLGGKAALTNQRPVRLALASTILLLAQTLPAGATEQDLAADARALLTLCAQTPVSVEASL
jgi:hypothetical protein